MSNWRLHHQMPLSRTSSAMSSSSVYVTLWARCTAFQQPPPQWGESLAMVASSWAPQGTHDWWCIVRLGVCEMQSCIVDTLASLDLFNNDSLLSNLWRTHGEDDDGESLLSSFWHKHDRVVLIMMMIRVDVHPKCVHFGLGLATAALYYMV